MDRRISWPSNLQSSLLVGLPLLYGLYRLYSVKTRLSSFQLITLYVLMCAECRLGYHPRRLALGVVWQDHSSMRNCKLRGSDDKCEISSYFFLLLSNDAEFTSDC